MTYSNLNIVVKTLTGKTITLDVEPALLIQSIDSKDDYLVDSKDDYLIDSKDDYLIDSLRLLSILVLLIYTYRYQERQHHRNANVYYDRSPLLHCAHL